MIELRMGVADLGRVRFAYSPLAEVAESLWMLSSGQIRPPYQGWYEVTRDKLRRLDRELLSAVVPASTMIAGFLLPDSIEPAPSIDSQLQDVANCPPDRFRDDLEDAWRGAAMPPLVRELMAAGLAGARRVADALWEYWSVAIEPHWPNIRAVLENDVSYRAACLTRGGIDTLFAGLHPKISVHGATLRIDSPRLDTDRDLSGAGLVLVPSVFAWPYLLVATNPACQPSLTYAARGVGTLWTADVPERPADDALGALLGRTRAAILIQLALPRTTTELARELGQSPPSISQHLSVLRHSGLVTSWRAGRRVLYQRTPLATSVVAASGVHGGRRNAAEPGIASADV